MKGVEIVNRALNLAGILARTLDSEDDEEGVDGLFWLNRVLKKKTVTPQLLPYFTHEAVTAIPNQQIYFIADLVTADVLTYSLNGVRYSVNYERRNKYFGSARPNNVSSLPYQWYWEKVVGGMNIYLFFLPADAYEMEITGLKGFGTVDYDTEFDDILDDFYQTFLMFETAEAMCLYYKMSLPPDTKEELKTLRNQIKGFNPPDWSIKKRSLLGNNDVLSYAQINISPGWTP